MEDQLTMSATNAFHTLDPELPLFSYMDAYLDYQVPDLSNRSYLSGTTTTYPSEDIHSAPTPTSTAAPLDCPKPHDDLSYFFEYSPLPSPSPNQRCAPVKSQTYSPIPWATQEEGWDNNNQHNATITGDTRAQTALTILTSGFETVDARTLVHYGQVTPGDSPKEMASGPDLAVNGHAGSARKGSRKRKESVSAVSWSSEPAASPAAKVKKSRKPRRSSKKTTAEPAAVMRESYLRKNREAAHRCRTKKKAQTGELVERVKALGEDNRVKSMKMETLRLEVEGLRVLLLSHYRVCGKEPVVAYLDGLGTDANLRGGARSENGCCVSEAGSGEGSESFGADQEICDEGEREEQRRGESEDAFMSSESGASLDSDATPVVEAIKMGTESMMGGMDEVLEMGVLL
ncbi:hypothetical protein V494_00350 [Pseudogymnoascus sp. VKM F-4513 (FW-928)]|nr:hypothetical protein V494_00350 [Pseudogymnoascus sp. VKM F-4513 (FW-928)]